MLIAYFVLYSILLVLFYIGRNKNTSKKSQESYYHSKTISVIIPFRNEEDNLPKLIDSIHKLALQPLEFIWVNDHSTDHSLQVLQHLSNNHQVINLTKETQGKKAAIRKGIKLASGTYILTWDADIKVDSNYFKNLEKTYISELSILPVRMKGKSFVEILYELDYYFLNSINIGIAGFTLPIVASGANLLFNKNVFNEIDSINNHKHIASGDDQFLLQDFKKSGSSIQVINTPDLLVETTTPHSFVDFMKQRLRWISKSKGINDRTTTWISILGSLYVLGFVCLLFTSSWILVLIFKIGIDILIFLPYLKVVGRKKITFVVPFFTLLYPIYFIGIGIGMLLFTPDWKERK